MRVIYYQKKDESYPVKDFIDEQDKKMAAKLLFAIELLSTYGISVPKVYSKHLVDGIFELRIKYSSNISRILYFFIKGDSAVLTNGFIKKTMLTPIKEIEIAKERRKDFMEREKK